MGIAVALTNWYNQFKRLNKGDGYTMNLFCEEVHKLEAELSSGLPFLDMKKITRESLKKDEKPSIR